MNFWLLMDHTLNPRVLNQIFLPSKLEDSVPDTAQFMNFNMYCDAFLTN